MTLNEKLDNLKKSEIVKLMYDNVVYGLRVVYFNVVTDQFEYYDFSLKHVTDKSVQDFVNARASKLSVKQLKLVDSLLITQEELDGKIVVREFKDEEDVLRVLRPLMELYIYKESKEGISNVSNSGK